MTDLDPRLKARMHETAREISEKENRAKLVASRVQAVSRSLVSAYLSATERFIEASGSDDPKFEARAWLASVVSVAPLEASHVAFKSQRVNIHHPEERYHGVEFSTVFAQLDKVYLASRIAYSSKEHFQWAEGKIKITPIEVERARIVYGVSRMITDQSTGEIRAVEELPMGSDWAWVTDAAMPRHLTEDMKNTRVIPELVGVNAERMLRAMLDSSLNPQPLGDLSNQYPELYNAAANLETPLEEIEVFTHMPLHLQK
jgi:hypothetical protein